MVRKEDIVVVLVLGLLRVGAMTAVPYRQITRKKREREKVGSCGKSVLCGFCSKFSGCPFAFLLVAFSLAHRRLSSCFLFLVVVKVSTLYYIWITLVVSYST